MHFLFALVAFVHVTVPGLALDSNSQVADVIKSIEAATLRQETALKTTTQKLRALQQRVNNLIPH